MKTSTVPFRYVVGLSWCFILIRSTSNCLNYSQNHWKPKFLNIFPSFTIQNPGIRKVFFNVYRGYAKLSEKLQSLIRKSIIGCRPQCISSKHSVSKWGISVTLLVFIFRSDKADDVFKKCLIRLLKPVLQVNIWLNERLCEAWGRNTLCQPYAWAEDPGNVLY
jgi:hypothetical protein